jgi:UDP-N-acetylmuramoyl-L-alanyl-D-glutamate--2,6-diaminopimelate ligase
MLRDLPSAQVHGSAGESVSGVAYHSQSVRPGALFVAIRGAHHDGHAFVADALRQGATALVVDHLVDAPPHVAQIVVADTRVALAALSATFFGHPSHEVTLVGITGTKGKGTTAYLLEAALSRGGQRAGVIGTLGVKLDAQETPLDRTTPEAPDLQRILRQMADAGVRVVVMEVASHALVLHRVASCLYRGAVFTNLTQDHLDFHKTLDAYRAAKRMLFEMVVPDGVSIVNADDPSAPVMAEASRATVITYGLGAHADVRADDVQLRLDGADFVAVTPHGKTAVHMRLPGRFNVSNALAAIAAAQHQGVALDVIARALGEFTGVPGRFESVHEGQPFGVIVDYAHTPDSLENVLRVARDFTRGRLLVVFGCGGDRDRTKRPVMGRIAAQLADVAVVTSDNPRSEEPGVIIEEILRGTAVPAAGPSGARTTARAHIEVEPDRRQAITRTLESARPGDVVVIAGKGHEPYQEIKGVKYPFDDRVVAREVLQSLHGSRPARKR